jgi:hypothetical protein
VSAADFGIGHVVPRIVSSSQLSPRDQPLQRYIGKGVNVDIQRRRIRFGTPSLFVIL